MYNNTLISLKYPPPLFLVERFINKKGGFVYFYLFYKILYYIVYIIYLILIYALNIYILSICRISTYTLFNIESCILYKLIKILYKLLKKETKRSKNEKYK